MNEPIMWNLLQGIPLAIGLFGLAIDTFLASSKILGRTEGGGLGIPWHTYSRYHNEIVCTDWFIGYRHTCTK